MEPPTIGAFVSVYFPHAQDNERVEKMCVDVRPVPTEGEVWDFAVRTNIRKPVRLAFENIASVPPEFSVMLVDEVLKTTQDVRERGSYVVPAKQTADPSRYKLLAGKPEFIQQQIALNNLIPTSYELSQNFPNPFNPVTTIRYGLPRESHVTLKIYNLLGQEVATLVDGVQQKGYRSVAFGGVGFASGVYLYRLQADGYSSTKRLVLLK
jgi:hypothetical protein